MRISRIHIPVRLMTQRSCDILETTLTRALVTRTIVRWKLSGRPSDWKSHAFDDGDDRPLFSETSLSLAKRTQICGDPVDQISKGGRRGIEKSGRTSKQNSNRCIFKAPFLYNVELFHNFIWRIWWTLTTFSTEIHVYMCMHMVLHMYTYVFKHQTIFITSSKFSRK